MNIHEANPRLIGYSIQQEPETKDHRNYKNAHPYIVVFIFKDGPDHIMFYSPSGQALGGQWETLDSKHWAVEKMRPVEELYHECRGNELQ